jgi:YVTN family beta-propeller protein
MINKILLLSLFLIISIGIVSATPYAYIPSQADDCVNAVDLSTNQIKAVICTHADPIDVALDKSGTYAYVITGVGDLDKIDTSTNTVVQTGYINLEEPSNCVIVSPDGSKVYISAAGVILIYDTTTLEELGSITIASGTGYPTDMVINADGTELYATDDDSSNTVYKIDTATNTVHTITVGGSSLRGIALSHNGNYIYTTSNTNLYKISTSDSSVTHVGDYEAVLYEVALNSDDSKIYVSVPDDGDVLVINTVTGELSKTIHVGGMPNAISLSPNGTRMYVLDSSSPGKLVAIDTTTDTIVSTLDVCRLPACFERFVGDVPTTYYTQLTTLAYIPDYDNDRVNVLNPTNHSVITTIAVNNPKDVECNPIKHEVYITHTDNAPITVIDANTNTIKTTIALQDQGCMNITPDGNVLYVSNYQSETVTAIDTASREVITTIPLSSMPTNLATTNDGKKLYVINGDYIGVISTESQTLLTQIHISDIPTGLSMSNDGSLLYVSTGYGSIYTINTENDTPSKVFEGQYGLNDLDISKDGETIVATSTYNNIFIMTHPPGYGSVAAINVISTPTHLLFSPYGSEAYILNNASNPIQIYNDSGGYYIALNNVHTHSSITGNFFYTFTDSGSENYTDTDPITVTQRDATQPLNIVSTTSDKISMSISGSGSSMSILHGAVINVITSGYGLLSIGALTLCAAALLRYFGYI